MFRFQEKILIEQIKNGNQSAFSRLYQKYNEKIYRFIFFKTSNQDVAQDLTSNVFIKVFDYLTNGQEIENFQAFLFQTAKNLVIDHYRARAVQELPIDEFVEENISDQKDVISELSGRFELEKIQDVLAKLPEPYREVIILRFVEDLPFKEIAQITGKTEGNLRVIVNRGLKLLRTNLS